jgi:hypothetical protein
MRGPTLGLKQCPSWGSSQSLCLFWDSSCRFQLISFLDPNPGPIYFIPSTPPSLASIYHTP